MCMSIFLAVLRFLPCLLHSLSEVNPTVLCDVFVRQFLQPFMFVAAHEFLHALLSDRMGRLAHAFFLINSDVFLPR
ncbi:uncharacterized protein BT62DRAFT_929658 [Guyanagaster necrorhizus]|uniref:Secreted protein n=1 Tax=Guyanagaster necrorhizus TaxID=856835 RepID=A0A9P7VXV4_9AGAR|nr:uncharacterized protein BT62DRAFT_929658 [Guyanagaster necrorhizus MCA 3950]KAG7448572.1 hypothetical protein BT62DRAFT_929658 [Guyanagaster necrorhizus MCA 3950]